MEKNKKDIFIFFIFKICFAIIGIVLVSLYTTYINPNDYGKYTLIIGFVNVLISIMIGWIGSASLRYYDSYKDSDNIFFSTVFLSWLSMLFFITITLFLIGKLKISIIILDYFPLVILITIGLSFINIFEKIIRASGKTSFYVISMLMQIAINLIAFYLLVNTHADNINTIFLARIISQLAFGLIVIYKFKVHKKVRIRFFSIKILTQLLKFGLPMVGVWGISWILSFSDRYLIKIFYSYTEVGLYDIAYKFAENSIGIVSSAFLLAIYPQLIITWNKNPNQIGNVLSKTFRYLMIILIPACVGLIGISKNIYGTILDIAYVDGVGVIIISSLGFLFMSINNLLYKVWQLKEKTYYILSIMVLSVTLNIALNIFLMPIFSYQIAAYTTLAAYFVATLITYTLLEKEYRIGIGTLSLLKILISSGIMYIFLAIFNPYIKNIGMLFIALVSSVSIYMIMLLILGELKEEKKYLIEKFKKF